MKKELKPEDVLSSATIYQFFHDPYSVVRAGTYKPSVFDCIALVCDAIPKCFLALWDKICQLSLRMTIGELLVWIILLPFWILVVLPLPFTFPLWGIFVYCRMRNERERFLVTQAELDRRLDGLHK